MLVFKHQLISIIEIIPKLSTGGLGLAKSSPPYLLPGF